MFQSLRFQFLLPLIISILIAVSAVSFWSYWRAAEMAKEAVERRLLAVTRMVAKSTFPLNAGVLDQIHELSSLEVAIIDSDKRIVLATSGLKEVKSIMTKRPFIERNESSKVLGNLQASAGVVIEHHVLIGDQIFDIGFSSLGRAQTEHVSRMVAVISPHEEQRRILEQALILPMATGIASALSIGTVAFVIAARFGKRLDRLRAHVNRIALGSFEVLAMNGRADEIANLTSDINEMTLQLRDMQVTINAHQRAKLINQIASGMAHQLRNTLTGARLAVQVHQRKYAQESLNDLNIAVDQLVLAEKSIQSLLQIRTGISEEPGEPMAVEEIMRTLFNLTKNKAEHKSIQYHWNVASDLGDLKVEDGQAVLGALINLVINAMEATSQNGQVECLAQWYALDQNTQRNEPSQESSAGFCRFQVRDDGPGPTSEIQDSMFEPFTTTKPEGIGLGLPMALRIAQRANGSLSWQRTGDGTIFELLIPVWKQKI